MKIISKIMKAMSAALVVMAMCMPAHAAKFSSTKVELLYGFDYSRGENFAEDDQALFTFANATGFSWGDSFLFFDLSEADDTDETGGLHAEWSVRKRFLKGGGIVKGLYGIGQLDIDANAFTNKVTHQAGLSLDWNVPGFRFVKTHLQYRNDPEFDGSSTQFNLVWNKAFKIGSQNFSFEGFADWTSSEGASASNFLTQPVLMWHPSKYVGIGIEYQYWKNRIGVEGVDEKAPQIIARWTF